MKLTLWTYEGPPHIGAMRVATAMNGAHYVLHAPQGDTYADLLFTMIERDQKRPPVTYTTFQARDLGGDTAELFKSAARNAFERFRPQVDAGRRLMYRRTDPGRSGRPGARARPARAGGGAGVARLSAQGKLGRVGNLLSARAHPGGPACACRRHTARAPRTAGQRPCCNLLGATSLGFRHRDDVQEICRLLA